MNYVIQTGDFAGWELPFNDPLLRLNSNITGEKLSDGGLSGTATAHINLLPVWGEYSGDGIRIGTGEEIEYTHHELLANYNADHSYIAANGNILNYDPYPSTDGATHGTKVAGIISSEANNGIGSVGIAHGAELTSYAFVAGVSALPDLMNRFDIVTNSTGGTDLTLFRSARSNYETSNQFLLRESLVENGRDGLGSIIFNSAGNSGLVDASTDTDPTVNDKNVITVGALNEHGIYNSTSFGSSVHIAATLGSAKQASRMITLDRSDVDGTSVTSISSAVSAGGLTQAEVGAELDDFNTLGGSSGSTPVVAAATALILEAAEKNNIYGSDLGWRDVQEILALSAKYTEDQNPSGSGSQQEWVVTAADNYNGLGMTFHPNVGFGALDVHAAVRLAETWNLTATSANMDTVALAKDTANDAIGDSITYTFTIIDSINIDFVELHIGIDHSMAPELLIEITSPSGVTSAVFDTPLLDSLNHPNLATPKGTNMDTVNWPLLSRSFWGEDSVGTWTVTVTDTVDNANTGTVNKMELHLVGDEATDDDVYYFTDDALATRELYQAQTGADTLEVPIINDMSGNNSLNFSAMTSGVDVTIKSSAREIDTQLVLYQAADELSIRTVIGTDKADKITGDDQDNIIHGRQGDDRLIGVDGDDELFGFSGDDTIYGGRHYDTIYGGSGDDVIDAGTHYDTIFGGEGDDIIDGGNGKDIIFMDGGNDTFNDVSQSGYHGHDTVDGGAGDDVFNSGGGDDTLTGGGGADTFNFVSGSDEDTITDFEIGHDMLTIRGFKINPTLLIDDVTLVQIGNDLLVDQGNGDSVLLQNVSLADWVALYGGPVDGSGAGDTIDAAYVDGDGDHINNLGQQIYGNQGHDIILAGSGDDFIYGGSHYDTIFGGAGDDFIDGGNGRDTVSMDNGNDTFNDNNQTGTHGQDTVDGGAGDDVFNGGRGNDVLTGGLGADTFNFASGNGDDIVTDFEIGIDALSVAGLAIDPNSLIDGVALAQQGADVLIDYGNGDTILLEGVDLQSWML